MTQSSDIVQAPPSSTYAEIGNTVRVLDGEEVKRVRDLMNTSRAMKQFFGNWSRCGLPSGDRRLHR
jgi:hypothetical protein